MRLYELLKQYVGFRNNRIFTLTELKSLLGLRQNAYAGRWNTLRGNIIDPFCRAVNGFSDLDVSYTTLRGMKNKVFSVDFSFKAKSAQQTIETCIAPKLRFTAEEYGEMKSEKYGIDIRYIVETVDSEFSKEELDRLIGCVWNKGYHDEETIRKLIKSGYESMSYQAFKKQDVRSRLGYLYGILSRIDMAK
jgi:plasmid replication initiation protein